MQLLSMIVFLVLSIMSSIVMMFVSSLFWVWVMTDMSTIFMIPFLSAESRPKKSWFTGVATYFIIQFFGSVMILFGMVVEWAFSANSLCSFVMCLGFSLKLGLVPFHFWVARSFMYLHYGGIFVVGAGQKVFVVACVPMFSDVPACAYIFYGMAIGSMLYGPVAMFNAITVKSFLAYSSVNHTGFLVVSSGFGLHLVYLYSFIYCVSMFFLTFILWSGNCKLMKDLGSELPLYYKTGFLSIALSFSGFPPFLDFCTKFVVIQVAMEARASIAIFAVLASSLMNLIVWIWVTSLAASSGMREAFTPSGSLGQNVLNISCVIWNLFMGMGFSMLY
uniref:NADH-ubiquinone oxidoreductase chain 2 n=2 Tax=Magallana TaxID=2171616 RepID=B6RQ77_MAGHO|nr:NADH dehydrogenase subunit 2 [Crassostrea hongkongensis]ABY26711.1 NADH dehydrogenase subunit 2 [Crassostrea hongkongensis]ACD35453.1 NADH dehydrogenase subunit 2 [Crassostrea hongkongensis]ACL80181.1 NADH dehydrogenase subunit 2 [Crassostrea hongkongensis]ACL80193.1 NADH dehydrogenase subunit 2 [Crassostrea hongkongensis]ACO40172.1 NADH dehydrogenase subunit 2 [Crassostrea hongkongensis]